MVEPPAHLADQIVRRGEGADLAARSQIVLEVRHPVGEQEAPAARDLERSAFDLALARFIRLASD
jgi:hypothetical protein